jgi:hypothetical protein
MRKAKPVIDPEPSWWRPEFQFRVIDAPLPGIEGRWLNRSWASLTESERITVIGTHQAALKVAAPQSYMEQIEAAEQGIAQAFDRETERIRQRSGRAIQLSPGSIVSRG